MRLPFLILFSLLIPIALRPVFFNNMEYFLACAGCGVLYGIIAGVVGR